MVTYRRQKFQGKDFILDEVVFQECTLTDCDLYYSGGDFELVSSRVENCRFHFRGAAKNTQALFQMLGMIAVQTPPKNLIPIPPQKPN